MALHSDWDRISADFVGLRGFGNVFWYPVASVPVFLGDGAKMFTEIGHQKLRQAAAKISMRVTQDFFGVAPNVAILDGQNVALTLPAKGEAPDHTVPQVVSFSCRRRRWDLIRRAYLWRAAISMMAMAEPVYAVGERGERAELPDGGDAGAAAAEGVAGIEGEDHAVDSGSAGGGGRSVRDRGGAVAAAARHRRNSLQGR